MAARRVEWAIRAGHREVTATEAPHLQHPRQAVQGVRPTWAPGGQVVATADKLRFSRRPATLHHLSLCQYMMFYLVARVVELGQSQLFWLLGDCNY